MENLNAIVRGNHQENEEKPPPRVCPRCGSDNTRFSFDNNYKVSQPRYNCKNCRRCWTHGGVLRNINGRKNKRARKDQPSVSQVDSFIQQVDHHQPFSHAQETKEYLGSFGGSSSSSSGVVGNFFSSFPETHGDMLPPTRSIPKMDRFDLLDGLFNQGCYYGAGFNDFVGNPLMNQSIGGHVDNYNSYFVNQEDPNKPNQSFNNAMNMIHNATTSGSRGFLGTDHMINNNNNKERNKSVFRSSYHLEEHGP